MQMLDAARAGRLLGITPDGPRGPRERVKPGTVFLASHSGLPVVPIASAASRAWVLESWDRFRIPKPFARVVVACGQPIRVPPEVDATTAERLRLEIESAIGELTSSVAERAGEMPVMTAAAEVTA